MIEYLHLGDIPCFQGSAKPIGGFTQLNLIYGPNGSGKSSIAKALAGEVAEDYSSQLYDKNFVDLLLRQDSRIPGVFVIRDAEKSVQQRLDALQGIPAAESPESRKGEIAIAEGNLGQFEKTIEQKEAELLQAREVLRKASWKKRKALDQSLQSAFEGFRSDSNKNADRVIEISERYQESELKSEDELVSSLELLKDEASTELQDFPEVPAFEEHPESSLQVLREPIRTADESSFGDFVRDISSPDWVRQGLELMSHTGGKCPFCQQGVPDSLADSLARLFDERYEQKMRSLQNVLVDEKARISEIQSFKEKLLLHSADENRVIFETLEGVLGVAIARRDRVLDKIASPSLEVELQDLSAPGEHLRRIVAEAQARVDKNNSLLRDRTRALANINRDVWLYYVRVVLAQEVSEYSGAIAAPTKALGSLRPKREAARRLLREKQNELKELQKQVTSAAPTVERINATLKGLGFLSFSIEHLEDDTYQLVRQDGKLASETLSEGERTFVSFLYFYHRLVRASEDRAYTEKVVAVIDDPVSSLDGETLFAINLLLRNLMLACVRGDGRLSQLFLLTHNAYFFKEADFTPQGTPSGERSYFILSKEADSKSRFERFESSPIRSNYGQLWDQVRAARSGSGVEHSAWLANAMRRIIENYFQIAGGLNTEHLVSQIPESERWACQSLLSWYNDGSHTAPWDVDYSGITADASVHLAAFRRIFEAAGHQAHYDMMMAE